jgi:hypothetical protein
MINTDFIKVGNMVEVKSWDEMVKEFGGEQYECGYGYYLKLPDGYTIYKAYLTREEIYDKLFENTPSKFTIKRLGDDLYNWATHKVSPYMVKPISNVQEKIKYTTQKIFEWYLGRFRRIIVLKDKTISVNCIKELYDKLLTAIDTGNYIGFTLTDIYVINNVWDWYVECSVDRKDTYLIHFDDGDSMLSEQWVYYFETNIKHQNNF